MYAEFQIATAEWLIDFANRFKTIDLCVTKPNSTVIGSCSYPWLIDHVEVDQPTIARSGEAGLLKVRLPFKWFLVTVADLPENGTQPAPPCSGGAGLNVTAVFDVFMSASDGVPLFHLRFSQVEADVPEEQKLFFALLFLAADQIIPLNLYPFNQLFNSTVTATDARIALSSDSMRIAIGLVFAGGTQVSDWKDFDSGMFQPQANGMNWSIFVSGEMMEEATKSRFSSALAAVSVDKFVLESGPDATYSPEDSQPVVDVTFGGEAIRACVCFWGEIDLNVDFVANAIVSVPVENTLQFDISIDWSLNKFKLACCSFTAALFWPLIGINFFAEDKIDLSELALGLVNINLTFTVGLFAAGSIVGDVLSDDLPSTWEKIDDHNYRLKQNFNYNALNIRLDLTGIFATANGLVLGGTRGPTAPLVQPHLSVIVNDFTWSVDPCNATDAYANADIWCDGGPAGSSYVPFVMCDAKIVSADPSQVYSNHFSWDGQHISISIPYHDLPVGFSGDAYGPCEVQIITNAGVRVITLQPIPYISKDEVNQMLFAALLQKPNCKEYRATEDFWKGGRFNPLWKPDPPWEVELVQHWRAVVSGLDSREQVTVAQHDTSPIATLTSTERGSVEFEADILTRSRSGEGLSLQRSSGGRSATPQRALFRQLALARASRIQAGEGVSGLCRVASARSTLFAVATKTRVLIYDFAAPAYPRLQAVLPFSDLGGIQSFGTGLFAWGRFGVAWVGVSEPFSFKESISSAAFEGNKFYFLVEGDLRILDIKGRLLGRISAVDGQVLAVSLGVIALAAPSELRFFESLDRQLVGRLPVHMPRTITPSRYADARLAFVVVGGSDCVVFGATGSSFAPVARYSKAPLLNGGVRVGGAIATLSSDRRAVDILSVIDAATVERQPLRQVSNSQNWSAESSGSLL